jgi:hypothetical protein
MSPGILLLSDTTPHNLSPFHRQTTNWIGRAEKNGVVCLLLEEGGDCEELKKLAIVYIFLKLRRDLQLGNTSQYVLQTQASRSTILWASEETTTEPEEQMQLDMNPQPNSWASFTVLFRSSSWCSGLPEDASKKQAFNLIPFEARKRCIPFHSRNTCLSHIQLQIMETGLYCIGQRWRHQEHYISSLYTAVFH